MTINAVYRSDIQALVFCESEQDAQGAVEGAIRVFVCGALQEPDKMKFLLGRMPCFIPAAVSGYERAVEIHEGRTVPFMIESPLAQDILTGVLWLDLTESEVQKIEQLELGEGFRQRIKIKARVGQAKLSAFTYIKK